MRRTIASASHMISESEIHLHKAKFMLKEAEEQYEEASTKLSNFHMTNAFDSSGGSGAGRSSNIHSQFFSLDSGSESTSTATVGSLAELEHSEKQAKSRMKAIQHVIRQHEISSVKYLQRKQKNIIILHITSFFP
jgi:hypothetical protein